MKNILVPTDFSEEAENALKIAAQLAEKNNSEIFLLHMLELPLGLVDPVMGTSTNDLPEALFWMKLAKKRFGEILTRPYLQGLKVHEIVQFHEAFEGIIETTHEHDCDLIVMGSKGVSGFKDIFIGSNTEKVVRTSDVPVLVIKHNHSIFQINDFIFATDFSEESRAIMPKVIQFAEFLDAKLHLVYINTASNFISSEESDLNLDDFMRDNSFTNYTLNVYNARSVEDGILKFAKKLDAGLIGVATHGRKGISHFFNGSISEDLVNHAKRPVITFKL